MKPTFSIDRSTVIAISCCVLAALVIFQLDLSFPIRASIAVVACVIIFQLTKFIQNRNRISMFSMIFAGQDYDLEKNEKGMIVGITGTGNVIFDNIKSSINGYLSGNQGTEVDFQLLKDTVDRHCDMIEDEINSQMPLPLYFGLAGTMIGAMIGLFALVWGDSILALMSGASGTAINGAAVNINDLLWGVAIAMIASACGIILTSWNTIFFKEKKLKEETDRNKFLAWVQSKVLSAVPSTVSQQMKSLVGQLATFNRNFYNNTQAINQTLSRARQVYDSQAKVIEEYQAINLEEIATGVSSIMRRLRSSTESLDNFTQYLNDVHGYYQQLQVFVEKLNMETDRIETLKDIKKFFEAHKGIISKETADAHKQIADSIKTVQKSTEKQVEETYKVLTEQSQKLKEAVDENNRQFNALCRDMREKFNAQLREMPSVAQNLRQLQDIPSRLDTAINRITQSQERLAADFLRASQSIAETAARSSSQGTLSSCARQAMRLPASLKWTVIVGVIVIALATVGNTAYNIYKNEFAQTATVTEEAAENNGSQTGQNDIR